MLTGIKIDNFTAFEQLDIRVGQLRVELRGAVSRGFSSLSARMCLGNR